MLYYDWKSIDSARAQRALDAGGRIWPLPICFGNGMARFTHGLQTPRGTNYVVSAQVFSALQVPAGALQGDSR